MEQHTAPGDRKETGGLRAFLFDFGGVLAEEGFREGLQYIARQQGLDPWEVHRLGTEAVYDSGFVLGRGTEAAFWELMRKRAGLKGKDEELAAPILERFVVRPRMVETVRSLRRQGFIVALLSDQTDWLDRLDRRYRFYREFDRVFNSFHMGKGKHDPSVFTDVVEELSIPPEAAMFVDDAPDNVERARAQGLRALLFRDEDEFLKELEGLTGRRHPHFVGRDSNY